MNFFVTGGSRGIGAGIVLEAVREGHDVAFCYARNKDASDEVIAAAKDIRPEVKIKAYQLDVADSAAVETVGDEVLDDFESIEVVVNCAGINRANLLLSMTDEEWDEVIGTNLNGPFYVCRKFLMSMIGGRFGRIINISSVQHTGASGQGNYAASKAGLNGLTQTIAKEYGRKGITANVVVPGFFMTDMTRETMPEQLQAYWKKYCPMPKGRMGEIKEIAKVVTFLTSEGGGFINGEIINVTGGLNWSA